MAVVVVVVLLFDGWPNTKLSLPPGLDFWLLLVMDQLVSSILPVALSPRLSFSFWFLEPLNDGGAKGRGPFPVHLRLGRDG